MHIATFSGRTRLFAPALSVLLSLIAASPNAQSSTWLDEYRDAASKLIAESQSGRFAWERLALLGDTFGHRLSGSDALANAITWAVDEMKKDGLENVRAEPVKVPHWVRGQESLEITSPHRSALTMLGLGNSVGTSPDGIEADLVVVRTFAELDAAGAGVRGALRYADGVPQIPSAAITTEDADRLQRMQNRGTKVRLRVKMEAKFLPDADSANVVGEIRGRERPDEIVVVSGHFDSWDVGTGSTDDGGGCVVTWEALRLLKQLNLRPRRTVRVVLFTNEENGLAGGRAYLERYRAALADHVMMLESDSGVYRPTGFGFAGSATARATVQQIATLLRGIQADQIGPSGGGADIGPSVEAGQVPAMSLEVEGNYFLIHHTPADTVDKIDPADMAKASAAIAVMAYVIADMPERLR